MWSNVSIYKDWGRKNRKKVKRDLNLRTLGLLLCNDFNYVMAQLPRRH